MPMLVITTGDLVALDNVDCGPGELDLRADKANLAVLERVVDFLRTRGDRLRSLVVDDWNCWGEVDVRGVELAAVAPHLRELRVACLRIDETFLRHPTLVDLEIARSDYEGPDITFNDSTVPALATVHLDDSRLQAGRMTVGPHRSLRQFGFSVTPGDLMQLPEVYEFRSCEALESVRISRDQWFHTVLGSGLPALSHLFLGETVDFDFDVNFDVDDETQERYLAALRNA